MARKSKKSILNDVHSEGLKRFETIQRRESQNRSLAVEDARFANDHDGMWDEETKAKRKDRPRLTINRVAPAIDQVVGDQRQNRTQIKVRPADGDSEKDIAEIYNGLIRNIESQSQAENCYDGAFSESVTGGYGGWRVNTEFADDDSFDQDIRIRPIHDAATSLYFGLSEHYDKRDASHAFYSKFISIDDFKKKYPNAVETDFSQRQYSSDQAWFRTDEIRIAEYWRKVAIIKTIGLMSDGTVLDLEEEKDVLDELAFEGITVEKTRKVKSFKVEMFVMNGAEILSGPMAWAGKYIPLVPVYGKISFLEGREIIRGLVRFAKDANRAYNYATSANIETVALTPKDPYWVTPTMVGEYKEQFENFTNKNSPFMLYNPDEKVGNQPPQRTGAPSVQQGLLSVVQQSAMDVETTTGLYSPAMGNAPQLMSEKSVISQSEKGDRGAFEYNDNLQKSIQYTGDILVDLLPKIYDTERTVRTLGIDGTSEVIKINENAFDEFNQTITDEQTGKQVIVNDLSRGKYDVVTETGAAFSTKKQESLAQLLELAAASEDFANLTGDLVAKSLDVIESEEIADRMRKVYIERGIAEPTEEEIEEMGLNEPQQPDPQTIALVENLNSQTAKNESDIANDQVEREKTMAETAKLQADTEAQLLEIDLIESGVSELLQDGDV